ncbi:hypothetical protein C8A00DRAFT_39028 [Chaetomidium leptoderma]|uniref:Uncharacterized protein n=1 Tax=Chaetomidium leptoderma TaxID=669021 RepID=A0AAN6VBM4_9PEZI|nr:hypothetical protein C8A00DRAFT_39028 [Chaetomidium leptoderma]
MPSGILRNSHNTGEPKVKHGKTVEFSEQVKMRHMDGEDGSTLSDEIRALADNNDERLASPDADPSLDKAALNIDQKLSFLDMVDIDDIDPRLEYPGTKSWNAAELRRLLKYYMSGNSIHKMGNISMLLKQRASSVLFALSRILKSIEDMEEAQREEAKKRHQEEEEDGEDGEDEEEEEEEEEEDDVDNYDNHDDDDDDDYYDDDDDDEPKKVEPRKIKIIIIRKKVEDTDIQQGGQEDAQADAQADAREAKDDTGKASAQKSQVNTRKRKAQKEEVIHKDGGIRASRYNLRARN